MFFKLVEQQCDRADIAEPSLPKKGKAPKHLEVGKGDGYHSFTVHEYYCREALDLATQSAQICHKLKLEALLVEAANRHDYSSELCEIISFYGKDFNESKLSTQLSIFGTNFAQQD